MIDNRIVGKSIATLRQARGMTQQQLAATLNVSHQAVSKWENGAALPDIQTLMDLTKLFGVTVEQLMSGDIPEARVENKTAQKSRPGAKPNLGAFFNGVFDDIGNLFRSEEPAAAEDAQPEDDGAADAKICDDDPGANDSKNESGFEIDLEKLLEMAPFMSRETVAEMLEKASRKLTVEQIARFAPFVDAAYLEKLISQADAGITWDTLKRVAPFLKKEAVDALARMAAEGRRFIQNGPTEEAAEDVCRTVSEVSEKIGSGVGEAFNKVIQFGSGISAKVSEAFSGLTDDDLAAEERRTNLRKSAFERALADERWDWIEKHLDELDDEALRAKIAERANQLGRGEWVAVHLGEYASDDAIGEAIQENDWGWLGDHVWKFSPETQQRVALAAMRAENWQWLSNYAEQISIGDCAVEIAENARKAGARMLAVQLAHYDMQPEQAEQTALNAVADGDCEYIDMIRDVLTPEALTRCAIRFTKAGSWDDALRLAAQIDARGLEWLMEAAIDAGNFDAIDILDGMLRAQSEPQDQPPKE